MVEKFTIWVSFFSHILLGADIAAAVYSGKTNRAMLHFALDNR